jgi:hypothetical protein
MKLFSVAMLFFCASAAFGQRNSSFYVSTTGNDSNPGTQAAPWRTVQHAANTVRAGSTVNVRGGIYEELVTIKTSGNAADGFITFRSFPGETQFSTPNTSRPPADRPYSRFTTRATCESKVLKFATSAPPNIGSPHWA